MRDIATSLLGTQGYFIVEVQDKDNIGIYSNDGNLWAEMQRMNLGRKTAWMSRC